MFFPRLKALRCIAASSWCSSNESLSVLYKAFLRALLTYTSPGWFPFLSVTNITKLERLHGAASRAISGCLSSSPIPLLLSEASLPPLRVTLAYFALSFYERSLCLPTSFSISGGQTWSETKTLQIALRLLTRSCFLLLLLESFSLLAFPHLLGTCLPSP